MTQAITVRLSERLYTQLKRAAELARQPVEAIVVQSLAYSLPPLLEDIPEEYQADVYPLLQMGPAKLQEEVQRILATDRWARYEDLLAKKRTAGLTDEEEGQLAALRREADVLMLRQGYAAVLLKRRGYHVPSPEDLPAVQ